MTEYLRIVDISAYYLTGGADWDKISANFDGVIIRAGVGSSMDSLLGEHVRNAIRYSVPYATYHIPAPASMTSITVETQAQMYYGWYGVADAVMCGDLEPPSSGDPRMVTGAEALRYMRKIDSLSNKSPIWYTNKQGAQAMSWPADLLNWYLWVAQWYYRKGTTEQYRDYETFIAERGQGNLPSWVQGTIYAPACFLWQISAKGDAQRYCAKPGSVRECDLSLSVLIEETARGILFPSQTPPPPLTLEQRVKRLEDLHGLV